ncbi:hypothetical protein JW851_01715 [Candidatus Woesearchaeota archaeon]|nr:hypothetical protein [Candidatus Woesearchaeota archaeon]
MVETSVLEKAINFVFGALIFLILIAAVFAAYHALFAEEPTIAEQNFDTILQEFKSLEEGSCFDVVIRPSGKAYSLFLYSWDNTEPGCSGRPCLCLVEKDKKCEILPDIKKDIGVSITEYWVTVVPEASNAIKICNKNKELSINFA